MCIYININIGANFEQVSGGAQTKYNSVSHKNNIHVHYMAIYNLVFSQHAP